MSIDSGGAFQSQNQDLSKFQPQNQDSTHLESDETKELLGHFKDPQKVKKMANLIANMPSSEAKEGQLGATHISGTLPDDLKPLAQAIAKAIQKPAFKLKIENELVKEFAEPAARTLLEYFQKAVIAGNIVEEVEAVQTAPKEVQTTPPKGLEAETKDYFRRYDGTPESALKLLNEAHQANRPALALYFAQKVGSVESLKPQNELYHWLKANLDKPPPSPKTLDYYAVTLGLGYKSANELVLQGQTQEVSRQMKNSVMRVPVLEPVSHIEMKAHIDQALNLEPLWKEFLDSFDPAQKQQYLARKPGDPPVPLKISEKGHEVLEKIQQQISNRFHDDPYFSLQIQEWLKTIDSEFVIVRSTGKEDSENNANAGGNDSVPFVRPNTVDISHAIGQVIASYFGKRSITQRLAAGDLSLFTEPPFMPVKIQEMVMEKRVEGQKASPLAIPRSGVLLTREPGKAEDVTLIQTGLGNNEGVVTSQVAVDTYMVDGRGNIHSTVGKKETRFVHVLDPDTNKYVAKEVENGDAFLAEMPALTDDIIHDLKIMSDYLAKYYGDGKVKPMDMEYSVLLPTKAEYQAWIKASPTERKKMEADGVGPPRAKLYLFQTRPLQVTQVKAPSSYLDLSYISQQSTGSVKKAETLIEGSADVRLINGVQEVLFADKLQQGLDMYLDAPDPGAVKVIITCDPNAVSTSHPAVTLRSKGVIVMVVKNRAEYEALQKSVSVASRSQPMLVDPQRGVIFQAKDRATAQAAIQMGYVSYPVFRQMSTRPGAVALLTSKLFALDARLKNVTNPAEAAKLRAELETRRSGLKVEYDALNALYEGLVGSLETSQVGVDSSLAIRQLIDLIATKDKATAQNALGILLKRLHVQMNKELMGASPLAKAKALEAWEQIVHLVDRELVPALEAPGQDLKRLYALKALESLIYQERSERVLHTTSLAQSFQISEYYKTLPAGESGARAHLLTLSKKNAFSEETSIKWNHFVAKLGPVEANRLLELTNELSARGLFSMWLNTQFAPAYAEDVGYTPQEIVSRLESGLVALRPLLSKFEKLERLKDNCGKWGEPEFYAKNISKLERQMFEEFGFDGRIASDYHNATDPLVKMAIIEFMSQAIAMYDASIKGLTGSDGFEVEAKEKAFERMLGTYFEMMRSTLKLVEPAEEARLMENNWEGKSTFDSYAARLEMKFNSIVQARLTKEGCVEQFVARTEFNVNPLIVGSHCSLNEDEVLWPERLEEFFTVFHQNAERILNIKKSDVGLALERLPAPIQEQAKGLQAAFKKTLLDTVMNRLTNFSAELSSISPLPSGEIKVSFAVPLGAHAGFVNLIFKPSDPTAPVAYEIELSGLDEEYRWDMAAAVASVLAHKIGSSDLPRFTKDQAPGINYRTENRRGVQFSLDIPNGFTGLQDFHKALTDIFYVLCYRRSFSPKQLEQHLIQEGYLSSLDQLQPTAFRDAFYLNMHRMTSLYDNGRFSELAEVAENTLLGMAKYGMDDFGRGGKDNGRLAPLAQKLGMDLNKLKKLKGVTTCYLIYALEKSPQAEKSIKRVLSDANVQRLYPEVVAFLKEGLLQRLPLPEQIEVLCHAGRIAEACLIVFKNPTLDTITQGSVEKEVLKLVSEGRFVDLYIKLATRGEKTCASDLLVKYMSKLDPDTVQECNKIIAYETNLGKLLKDGKFADFLRLRETIPVLAVTWGEPFREALRQNALQSRHLLSIYRSLLESGDEKAAVAFENDIIAVKPDISGLKEEQIRHRFAVFLKTDNLVDAYLLAEENPYYDEIVDPMNEKIDELVDKAPEKIVSLFDGLLEKGYTDVARELIERVQSLLKPEVYGQIQEHYVDYLMKGYLAKNEYVDAILVLDKHPKSAVKWGKDLQLAIAGFAQKDPESAVEQFLDLFDENEQGAKTYLEIISTTLSPEKVKPLRASVDAVAEIRDHFKNGQYLQAYRMVANSRDFESKFVLEMREVASINPDEIAGLWEKILHEPDEVLILFTNRTYDHFNPSVKSLCASLTLRYEIGRHLEAGELHKVVAKCTEKELREEFMPKVLALVKSDNELAEKAFRLLLLEGYIKAADGFLKEAEPLLSKVALAKCRLLQVDYDLRWGRYGEALERVRSDPDTLAEVKVKVVKELVNAATASLESVVDAVISLLESGEQDLVQAFITSLPESIKPADMVKDLFEAMLGINVETAQKFLEASGSIVGGEVVAPFLAQVEKVQQVRELYRSNQIAEMFHELASSSSLTLVSLVADEIQEIVARDEGKIKSIFMKLLGQGDVAAAEMFFTRSVLHLPGAIRNELIDLLRPKQIVAILDQGKVEELLSKIGFLSEEEITQYVVPRLEKNQGLAVNLYRVLIGNGFNNMAEIIIDTVKEHLTAETIVQIKKVDLELLLKHGHWDTVLGQVTEDPKLTHMARELLVNEIDKMDTEYLNDKIDYAMRYWDEKQLPFLIDALVTMKNLEPRLKSIISYLQVQDSSIAEKFVNLLRSKVPQSLFAVLEGGIKATPRISEHFLAGKYAEVFVELSSHDFLVDSFRSEMRGLRYLDREALVAIMQKLLAEGSLAPAKTFLYCLEEVIRPNDDTILQECKGLLPLKPSS